MARAMSFMGENATVITNRPLTYVIYWRPRGGPNGHAAMLIDSSKINTSGPYEFANSLDDPDNYVSWLGGTGTKNPLVFAGTSNTLRDDMQAGWGGHRLGATAGPFAGENVPTRWVALRSLDIGAMSAEWAAIRAKDGAHWKLIDKNCASVVARVLKAGCRSVGAKGSWNTRSPLFWTPDGVIAFAKSLTGFIYSTSSD